MTPKAKELHQKIENDLLEIMDRCNNINRNIHNLHRLKYDYGRYLSVLSEISNKAKTMLNYSFDKLAVKRKEREEAENYE